MLRFHAFLAFRQFSALAGCPVAQSPNDLPKDLAESNAFPILSAQCSIMANLPATLGYRMAAEWEPHEATWIAWPHERTDWPGKFAAIPWVFAEIVRHLHDSEQVNILVNDARGEIAAKHVLAKLGLYRGERVPKESLGTRAGCEDRIRFWRIPTDRGWMRDCGPIFVTNPKGKLGLTNWRFNGWGKYPNW